MSTDVPRRAPTSDPRHARGRAAEQAALDAAKADGWSLVARNYRCRRGEIDLILIDGTVLVFAEVRFRSHTGFGSGADSITAAKRRRIIAAARHFLGSRYPRAQPPCRFDVVSVGPPDYRVEWIRNAFGLDF